jgi:Spy/CpxP family protein refolding chaperone
MSKLVLAAAILSAASALGVYAIPASAEEVPCEDALKTLRDTVAGAKLSDADKAKVDDLQAKGIERCNADDDARADAFFADAMKILGK